MDPSISSHIEPETSNGQPSSQTEYMLQSSYREQDERDTLIFNLLLINKWFLIPTSVIYLWLLTQNGTARITAYGYNTPTVMYISLSLLMIVVLYIAHNRIVQGTSDTSYIISAQIITIFLFITDIIYIFFLFFNPNWGNPLWIFYLLAMSFPLLVYYVRFNSMWLIDGVLAITILALILISPQFHELLLNNVTPSPPRIPQGDLLIILSGSLYLWIVLRLTRSWIDNVHHSYRKGEKRVELWTDMLRNFPADFFLANELGEVLIASEGAEELLDLPASPLSSWPPQTETVRNAILLRFHSDKPTDDPIILPDDERDIPVKIFPAFFYIGKQRFCIALLQEDNPEAGTQLGIVRSDRLAIAGQIAAGLAHEIGNPLGVIRSCAEYLRHKASSSDPNKTEFELIESESIRCQNLIDRLLSLASPKRDTPGIHDLRNILEHSISMVRYQAGSRELFQTMPEEIVPVYVNEGQISAVFVNLLLNALQSMEGVETGLTVRVLLKVRGDYAIVDITDEGCGISSHELNRIFDPFFTKKASGTGLGLYIVHQIVTSAGGSIDVASKLGSGTTFTVKLPLYDGYIDEK